MDIVTTLHFSRQMALERRHAKKNKVNERKREKDKQASFYCT
jgi:hypothetical protein